MLAEAALEALVQDPVMQVLTTDGDLRIIGLPADVSASDVTPGLDRLQSHGRITSYKPLPAPAHGFLVLQPAAPRCTQAIQ